MKAEFLDFLYLARYTCLALRHDEALSRGGPLTINVSSLERIGELCMRNGIRLVFFNAPQNPKVRYIERPRIASSTSNLFPV